MALPSSDLRLAAHPLESGPRLDRLTDGTTRWVTWGRCGCAQAARFSSTAPRLQDRLVEIREKHEVHVVAVEGPRPPTLSRAQADLLCSWDDRVLQLRPPNGQVWHRSAARLAEMGLLQLGMGWEGATRTQRVTQWHPTEAGHRLLRLLRARAAQDPLRRRLAAGR